MNLLFSHGILLTDVVVHGFSCLERVALLGHRSVLGLHYLLKDFDLVPIDAPPLGDRDVDDPVDELELFNQIEFDQLSQALSDIHMMLNGLMSAFNANGDNFLFLFQL